MSIVSMSSPAKIAKRNRPVEADAARSCPRLSALQGERDRIVAPPERSSCGRRRARRRGRPGRRFAHRRVPPRGWRRAGLAERRDDAEHFRRIRDAAIGHEAAEQAPQGFPVPVRQAGRPAGVRAGILRVDRADRACRIRLAGAGKKRRFAIQHHGDEHKPRARVADAGAVHERLCTISGAIRAITRAVRCIRAVIMCGFRRRFLVSGRSRALVTAMFSAHGNTGR